MNSIQVTNPYLRSGPSCRGFKSTTQLSLGQSPLKLPALAVIVAEVLTLQAYSPSRSHDYTIDLSSCEIRRSRLHRRKFVIGDRGRTFNVFCNTIEDADVWETILCYASSRRFDQHYRLGRKVADGRHSQVYMAYLLDGPSTPFIVKVNNRVAECNGFADRSQFERDAHLSLVQSFDVTLKQRNTAEKKVDVDEREHREYKLKLSLDKIVTLRDCFGTANEDFLVFEHQGGELLSSTIETHGALSEGEARVVMWDLLTALHYMHEHGVVHRDIRASNVFYWKEEDNTRAKLFDLSEARPIPDGISGEEPFRDSPGKSEYKAIEILSGRYHGKPADIWSCGVLLYHMLSGTVPFQGRNEQELNRNITEQLLDHSLFNAPIWTSISQGAISLVKQMLQPDPFKRPSAVGARSHQWLSNDLASRLVFAKSARASPSLESERHCRALASLLDANMLPAPLQRFEEPELHRALSEPEDGPQTFDASLTSDKTQTSTVFTVQATAGKEAEVICTSVRSLDLTGIKGSFSAGSASAGSISPKSVSPVSSVSLNSPVHVESYGNMAVSMITKACSVVRQKTLSAVPSMAALSNMIRSPSLFQSSHPKGLEAVRTNSEDRPSRLKLVPLTRKFPDREMNSSKEAFVNGHGLTHECNHLCNVRQCKRSRMRTTLLRRARARSRPRTRTRPTDQVDRAACAQGREKKCASSDAVSKATILAPDDNSLTSKTKFSPNCPLKPLSVDPLLQFKANPEATKIASQNEDRSGPKVEKSSSKRQPSASDLEITGKHVSLRDEMCKKRFVMHSVIMAANIGLSEYSRMRPVVAKFLLRSPTAQLQLGMVLPYRRKFRTAGIALKAMFRIISLKKGTCLTRRVARGQTFPTELWTLITDIRRKCHMRPLRARMPKLLPPDEFGGIMRKPRFESPPPIEITPHRFWDRQREVRLGIVRKAWEVTKEKVSKLGAVVGAGHGNGSEEGHEEESRRTTRPGSASYLSQRVHGFFRRDVEEEDEGEDEEEEEKYHYTLEMV